MFILPSYIVTFCPSAKVGNLEWQVNTDEGLEAFCKVLRLNGVTAYSVKPLRDASPSMVIDDLP